MRIRFDEIYERLNFENRISTKTSIENFVFNWTNSSFHFFESISIEKKNMKTSCERSKNAMNFSFDDVFTIWNRKAVCRRRFRSTLKQKFVLDNKNERNFQIRLRVKRNFCRSRWRIVSNRRFWSKMKLNFWAIKWKKKNWRSFRLRSKKKRNHFVSSKNVRSYWFWSKMKRNFFAFRKINFRSCRFRSKMKSNSRSHERTINSFRMKLRSRTIRKKKFDKKHQFQNFVFRRQSQTNHVFVDSISDRKKFDNFSINIWNDSDESSKKKEKKNSDVFEFRIRKRIDFVVKKSCSFCVDEKKKENVDSSSKFLINNEKIFWFLILMKTFFFLIFVLIFFFNASLKSRKLLREKKIEKNALICEKNQLFRRLRRLNSFFERFFRYVLTIFWTFVNFFSDNHWLFEWKYSNYLIKIFFFFTFSHVHYVFDFSFFFSFTKIDDTIEFLSLQSFRSET